MCVYVHVCVAVSLLDTTKSESLNWITYSTGDGTTRRGVSNTIVMMMINNYNTNGKRLTIAIFTIEGIIK